MFFIPSPLHPLVSRIRTIDPVFFLSFFPSFLSFLSFFFKKKALAYALDHSNIDPSGIWVEFGVYSGTSVSIIAQAAAEQVGPEKIVHGFDSFRGLPSAWRVGFEEGEGKARQGREGGALNVSR